MCSRYTYFIIHNFYNQGFIVVVVYYYQRSREKHAIQITVIASLNANIVPAYEYKQGRI